VLNSLIKLECSVYQTGLSSFNSSNSTMSFVKFQNRLFTPHPLGDIKGLSITLYSVQELNELQELFNLPRSEEAYTQFYDLDIYMQALQHSDEADQWKYIWGNSQYRSSKSYKSMIGSRPIHPAFK
jgi:hypothetical protein